MGWKRVGRFDSWGCRGYPGMSEVAGARLRWRDALVLAVLSAVIVGGLGVSLMAGTAPIAPEIDGSSIATGLALASGAVLILRARRRQK